MKSVSKTFNLSDALAMIEHARVEKHLRRVLTKLRRNEIPSLTAAQAAKRVKTLRNLETYVELGEFPVNDYSFKRHPIFVDKFGNYCAMGFLLHMAGQDELVEEIRSNDNLVYIDDTEKPEYLKAINELGLSQEEAAQIQPSYGGLYGGNSVDDELQIIRAIGIVVYIVFQIFSLFLVRELNITAAQTTLLLVVMFSGSSLVGIAIWAMTIT